MWVSLSVFALLGFLVDYFVDWHILFWKVFVSKWKKFRVIILGEGGWNEAHPNRQLYIVRFMYMLYTILSYKRVVRWEVYYFDNKKKHRVCTEERIAIELLTNRSMSFDFFFFCRSPQRWTSLRIILIVRQYSEKNFHSFWFGL